MLRSALSKAPVGSCTDHRVAHKACAGGVQTTSLLSLICQLECQSGDQGTRAERHQAGNRALRFREEPSDGSTHNEAVPARSPHKPACNVGVTCQVQVNTGCVAW